MDVERLWDDVRRRLEAQVSAHDRDCWLDAVSPCELRGSTLIGEVPTELHAEQIRRRLGPQIDEALQAGGSAATLTLSVNPTRAERVRPSTPRAALPFGKEFTFERFVVGDSNAAAVRASHEIVESPRGAVLFLFGGVGLGKSHLLRAIGNATAARSTSVRLRLLTAEQFTNDLIKALRSDQAERFRSRFRDVDLLVVDDVQFLAGKERTQEEFFHTFDTLHSRGTPIVLASDQPPRDIRNLESRLRSRFESGWIADVKRPDRRLRRAIAARKAEDFGLALRDDVLDLVADRIVGSVRELEGALRRLIAASALGGGAIDTVTAAEILRPLLRPQVVPTVAGVKRLVGERFHVCEGDLVHRRRAAAVVLPRQVAMYLSRQHSRSTFAEIAAEFGGGSHTTVVSAVKAIAARRLAEPSFARLLESLEADLREEA